MKAKQKLKIGIQGGIGSFNESAVLHYLNSKSTADYEIIYLYTTQKVLAAISKGSVDLGLFAIHNSLSGIVQESIEAMGKYSFQIEDKISIPIQHYLMVLSGSKAEELERVIAHPQVFAQCQDSMKTRHSNLPQQSGSGDLIDTARAAEALYKGEIPNHTAILGPKRLAELYDFEIIDSDLQDDSTNLTTFLLVKKS